MKVMMPKDLIKEIQLRVENISELLRLNNIDAILLNDSANIYYTSGRIFNGYSYITKDLTLLFYKSHPPPKA